MNLRLLGAPTLKDIVPAMVDASNLSSHIVSVPGDRLYDSNCELLSFLAIVLPAKLVISDETLQHAQMLNVKPKL